MCSKGPRTIFLLYEDLPLEEYPDDEIDRLLQNAQKRSSLVYLYRRACVRRGGSCDHRPDDCCYNSSCRCNLWGANCRCQRKGLFQKWGK
ncbi:xibalbin-1-like isoform X2 [Lycorma delicatula]|uniref:xibalbin-1-like isoform X2 n=1 Tax=Lycorma delicatula TaxID=130591 RepID=UPI003F5146B2